MKTTLLSVILLLCVVSLHAQLKLDVAGNARIKGRLDVQSDGTLNLFIGPSSGLNNTDGKNNIFIGPVAGFSNTSGSRNTIIGAGTGLLNMTGSFNTFLGDEAGRSNTAGNNTFIGSKSGYANTEGQMNTFVGHLAGLENEVGNKNTFIGQDAGRNNTGGSNTFVGNQAGLLTTEGYQNTFIGQEAGSTNITGDFNIVIGAKSNDFHPSGDLQTVIGVGIVGPAFSDTRINNTFALGSRSLINSSHSGILGNVSMQRITGYVNWGTASDGRMKKQVREDVQGLDFILQLRPVTYQVDALKMDRFLRGDDDTVLRSLQRVPKEEREKARVARKTYEGYLREKAAIRYTGFIAQEVEEAMSQTDFAFSGLVKPAHDRDHYSLRYAEFVVPLVKATQEQQEIIREQQSQIANLEFTLRNQQRQIDELKDMVNQLLDHRTGESNGQEILPEGEARLHQIVPNPARRNATIDYEIPSYVQSAPAGNPYHQWEAFIHLSYSKKGSGQPAGQSGCLPARHLSLLPDPG